MTKKEEIKKAKEEVFRLMEKYGKYFTSNDIRKMISSCSTMHIRSAFNQIMIERGERTRIEIWLESFITNEYKRTKRIPKKQYIIRNMINFFKTPYTEKDGKVYVPKEIDRTIERVKSRIIKRARSGKIKAEGEAIEKILTDLKRWEKGEIEELELLTTFFYENQFIVDKSTAKSLIERMVSKGIPRAYFMELLEVINSN